MESFFALFYAMGVSTMFFDNWSDNFDIIGSLPLEVASMILRMLDPKTLLTAAQVSKKWLRVIKSDKVLRRTLREEFARQRKEKMAREMFLSQSVINHFSSLAKARESPLPYPDLKKSGRKFAKSIKTVDKAQKKMSWVASVSTKNVKKLR